MTNLGLTSPTDDEKNPLGLPKHHNGNAWYPIQLEDDLPDRRMMTKLKNIDWELVGVICFAIIVFLSIVTGIVSVYGLIWVGGELWSKLFVTSIITGFISWALMMGIMES